MITSTTIRQGVHREFRQFASAHSQFSGSPNRYQRIRRTKKLKVTWTKCFRALEKCISISTHRWVAATIIRLKPLVLQRADIRFHLMDEEREQAREIAVLLINDARKTIENIGTNPFIGRTAREHGLSEIGDAYGLIAERMYVLLDMKHREVLAALVVPEKPPRTERPIENDDPWEAFVHPSAHDK